MSSNSPDVVIFDGYGIPLAVQNGAVTPSNTSGLMMEGSDGTNSRYITVDTSGRQVVVGPGIAGTPAGGVVSVQGVSGGTSIPVSSSPPTDVYATASLSALNASVSINTQGASTLLIYVSGTWSGTILADASPDNGVTYPGSLSIFTGIAGSTSFLISPTGITANGFYYVSCAASRLIRIRMSAYTSGTAVIEAVSSSAQEYVRNLSFVTDGVNFANIAPANSAPTTSNTALVVALSPNLPGGAVPVSLYPSGAQDVQGNAVTVSRITQITTKFYQQPPSAFLNITTSGGATATQGSGTNISTAVFSTGTAATADVIASTFATVSYATQYEAYGCMSAKFTTPTSAASYQRIGIYNSTDGFSFGYNGTTFGLWTRFNGTDTFVAQTAWNKDTLSGAAGSYFTNSGSPVALVTTDHNMYRIRYAWYGATPAYFEVMAPDGAWVLVHLARFSNTLTTVNITQPDLPMTIDVSKTTSDATNLSVIVGAMSAGVSAPATGPIVSGIQTIASNGASIILPMLTQSSLSFTISGTWVGTLAFNYSLDGVTFTSDNVLNNSTGAIVTSTTINNAFTANVGSYKYYQIIATAWTSGTATITYNSSGASNVLTALSLITDASNHGPVAVKAASTAPVATDPALVVTESPNSPDIALLTSIASNTGASAADFIVTGTITATSGNVSVTGQGVYTVTISITGTWAATLYVQGQLADNTWVQLPVYAFTAGATSLPYLAQSTITANGTYIITGGGYQNIRVFANSYTSGTVNVGLEGSLAQQTIFAAQLGQWNMSGSAIEQSGNISGNGNIIALPGGAISSIQGYAGVTFEISGTWSGVITLQGSNGGSYYPVAVINMATPNSGPQSSITANGLYYAPVGFLELQLVMSSYVSGTVNVYSSLHAIPPALSPASPTATVAGSQALLIENAENTRQTYSIGLEAFASAATNQDVFCLIGSSTKVVRLTRILFSMTTTTAVNIPVQLLKRSTLNTGGSSGVAAITPHDSNNAAATATNLAYITNQTTNGTIVGTMIRSQKYFAQVATPTTPCQLIEWVFGQNGSQAPTLRSNTTELCINLGGVTIAGGSVSISIEWTEDSN